MLTASESEIYGRFGYGIAAWRLGLSAQRAHVRFRDTAPDAGSMRLVTRPDGEVVLPAIYERTRRLRAGMVSRPDFWWPAVFWDWFGGPTKPFFVAVHANASGVDDGYVAYEMMGEWHGGLPDRRLVIWDLQAESPETQLALWRFLFGVDLVGTVAGVNLAIDDPLRLAVTDTRRIRVDYVNDGLWIAPLDIATTLAARTYAIDGALVIEVEGQCYKLDGGPAGAQCTTTDANPDLVCPRSTVGAALLGGVKWTELAAAGLADERVAGALVRADLMFSTAPAPVLLSYF